MLPRQTNASTTSTCPSAATCTVELEVEEGTCRILVFDHFLRKPKRDASSCMTVRNDVVITVRSAAMPLLLLRGPKIGFRFAGATCCSDKREI